MRTPITLKIKFKSGSLDQFIERYSVDVSRGGIFIRTKEPLAVGTQLKFEFQLQDASSLIAGEGTVVWIREHDPTRTGVAPGMGVRFDRLQPASQQVLDRILTEKSKRGDSQMESRFDAGVRASATASGTVSTPDKAAAHNDFAGGDSKSHTPLPAPVPGLDNPGDEFAEESTRVMQNEIVQALADKTREAASFDNEPTRKASKEHVDALANHSTQSTAEVHKLDAKELADKPAAAKVEVAAPVEAKVEAKVEKELPKDEKKEPKKDAAAAEPASSKDKEPPREAERKVAVAAPVPARRSSAMLPGLIIVGAVVAAGAYYAFRGGETPATTQRDPDKVVEPLRVPSIVAEHLAKPPENPATPDKPVATIDKPAVEKPAIERPAVEKPAIEKAAGTSVQVVSEPPGAQVTLDGKPLPDATPTTLTGLDAKKVYDVRVAMKGFHEWKVKLKPKAGEKLDAALVPNEKLVEVS
ncbi:MAG TPA: TIGR02266 family protein, partial [Polyangia bacterium]|nr:TIGR02266 family protein [Polyangia bacterium]